MMQLVGQFGLKKWSAIAAQLKGRLGKQCRERYFNHLDPSVRNLPPPTHTQCRLPQTSGERDGRACD